MSVVSVEAVREFYRESFRPNDPELSVAKVLDFIDYCMEFYGIEGVYPYGFHFSEICEGLIARMKGRPALDWDGDSVDRELVRDFILDARERENAK